MTKRVSINLFLNVCIYSFLWVLTFFWHDQRSFFFVNFELWVLRIFLPWSVGIHFLLPGHKMPNTPFLFLHVPSLYSIIACIFWDCPLCDWCVCVHLTHYHLQSSKLCYAILTTVDWQLWSEKNRSQRTEAKK